jgi:peptidyl-prolyl cis-trans isomerase D
MFEFVRTHTKLLLFVLVILIIPSFVFFGVQGYTQFNDPSNRTVASVDGRKITQREWDAAHQRRIEQVRRQVPGIDARLLDSPEFKRETLDALVRDEVLRRAAETLHLATTDDRLQRSFLNDPQLAFLRQADGRINRDLLAAQGMSVEQFESRLRYDLTIQQVLDGVTNSATPAALPARTALNALLERREVQVQTFAASDYATTVRPSDDDIAAYYNDPANQAQFRAPEQARIEYVVLDLQALARGITVPEEDLRKYYEENAARYTQAEERRASHILVKADRSASADERAKAKAKAESLLAQARANPQQFAALAKAHSDDPGSAAQGGDLDWFGRGAMVKPFEDAVFAMKPGEISPLVETDFGYHIIRLDAVRGGERRPFDSVRAEITEEVRRQLALRKYAEAAEQFSNTVYEQPDSFKPVADKLGLEVRTATVQRTPAPGASGALASVALLEAVFAGHRCARGATPRRSKSARTSSRRRACSSTSRSACARSTRSRTRCAPASWRSKPQHSRARTARPGWRRCAVATRRGCPRRSCCRATTRATSRAKSSTPCCAPTRRRCRRCSASTWASGVTPSCA